MGKAQSSQSGSYNLAQAVEEYDSQQEGVLEFTIKKFSSLKKPLLSKTFYAYGWPFNVVVCSKKHHDNKMYLSVFVQCNPSKDVDDDWILEAEFTITVEVARKKPGALPKTRRFLHVFNKTVNSFGDNEFISFDELLDPDNGYIYKGGIKLSVNLMVGVPDDLVI